MTCNENCDCKIDEEEDDYEIQRLQDIIAICEFLIKHKRNQKSRDALDELLEAIEDSKPDEITTVNKDDSITIKYHPWYPYTWYPWYYYRPNKWTTWF